MSGSVACARPLFRRTTSAAAKLLPPFCAIQTGMALSFFRSRGARDEEAPLPLVTALPAGRHETVVLAEVPRSEDVPAVRPAEGPQPEGFEDDVMRNVFAQLNSVESVPPVAATVPEPADAAPDRMTDVPTGTEDPIPAITEPADVVAESHGIEATAPDHASDDEGLAEAAHDDISFALPPAAASAPDIVADAEAVEPEPPSPPPHLAELLPEATLALPDDSLVAGMLAAEAAAASAPSSTTGRRAARRLRLHLPRPHWPAPRRRAGSDARSQTLSPQDRVQRWLVTVSLLPVPVIVGGAFLGTLGCLAALALVTALFVVQGDLRHLRKGPILVHLPAVGLAGFAAAFAAILVLSVFMLTGGLALGVTGWVATLLSTAVWLAQCPARAARDLAAARKAGHRRAGQLIFALLLLPYRPAAERLLHRRLGATGDDPLTSEAGESVYAFAAHALPAAIVAGYEMERLLMRARLGSRRGTVHPHLVLGLVSLAWLCSLVVLFGPLALPVMLILATLTEAQLLVSDYMRHYGLQRRKSKTGSHEPLSPAHIWAAPRALGDLLLRLTGVAAIRPGSDGAPVLPRSLPEMALRALVPPLWHEDLDARVMALAKRNVKADRAEAR